MHSYIAAWNRVLTWREMRMLAVNPYCVFYRPFPERKKKMNKYETLKTEIAALQANICTMISWQQRILGLETANEARAIEIRHLQGDLNSAIQRIKQLECPKHIWNVDSIFETGSIQRGHEIGINFVCLRCKKPEKVMKYELKGAQRKIAEAMGLVKEKK